MSQMIVPPPFRTEEWAYSIGKDCQTKAREIKNRKPKRSVPKFKPATDWLAAKEQRLAFDLKYPVGRDPETLLQDLIAEQRRLTKRKESLEDVLKDCSVSERRQILGYEARSSHRTKGLLDTRIHIDGSLDKLNARLTQIAIDLPALEAKAELYRAELTSLWSWARITEAHRVEEQRNLTIAGKSFQAGREVF